MSETADQHSMHAAMQTIASQARDAPPEQAAHGLMEQMLLRIQRGINDARSKGCSDTQLAYLIDLHQVLVGQTATLAQAVGAAPGEQGEEAPVAAASAGAADGDEQHDGEEGESEEEHQDGAVTQASRGRGRGRR